ncbi:MAG TPA: hypothetical protein VHE11_04615 [Steroidobacteraceae bacterium]|nr:hypothetical protein [Steroidobacteraceae bacterium]
MTDEFEQALRRALRPQHPGEDFSARIVPRLVSSDMPSTPAARLGPLRLGAFRSRWLPAALAACVIAGIGLVQVRRHALDAARANQARAELLQALSIASDNVNIVRAAIAREESPDS